MASLVCKIGGGERHLSCTSPICMFLGFAIVRNYLLHRRNSRYSTAGELDLLYKLSATGRSTSNVCRNLHRLIHREGLTIPVQISFVNTVVRKRRPIVKKMEVHYPVIYPSSWMRFLLQSHSHLILGGVPLESPNKWQALLSEFWSLYKLTDGTHVMNGHDAPPANCTVPLYIHGDEGRGKYKLPIMVESIQPCISFRGPSNKNSSGSFDPAP